MSAPRIDVVPPNPGGRDADHLRATHIDPSVAIVPVFTRIRGEDQDETGHTGRTWDSDCVEHCFRIRVPLGYPVSILHKFLTVCGFSIPAERAHLSPSPVCCPLEADVSSFGIGRIMPGHKKDGSSAKQKHSQEVPESRRFH